MRCEEDGDANCTQDAVKHHPPRENENTFSNWDFTRSYKFSDQCNLLVGLVEGAGWLLEKEWNRTILIISHLSWTTNTGRRIYLTWAIQEIIRGFKMNISPMAEYSQRYKLKWNNEFQTHFQRMISDAAHSAHMMLSNSLARSYALQAELAPWPSTESRNSTFTLSVNRLIRPGSL